MLYSLTDKLKFDDQPQLQIKDEVLTINSDAETVLKIMDTVSTKGDTEGTLEAVNLLFNEEDRAKLRSLKLSMEDYMTVISTAMQLAVGEDPDEEQGEQ